MKRSEMINKMADIIGEHLDADGGFCAEKVLDMMEEKGMLPPCARDSGAHIKQVGGTRCNDYIEECDFAWEIE